MTKKEVAADATTSIYEHAQAFQEAFGVRDAGWFLAKAGREVDRYHAAADAESRLDALLNFSSSIIALEDWAMPSGAANEADWRGGLRSESAAHGFITLIALVAKHRRLGDGRFSHLRFETGQIQFWSEDPSANHLLEEIRRATPSARIVTVRAHIEDDQIEGYAVTVEIDGLMHEGKLIPIETVMREALSFWRMRLNL